MNVEIGRNRVYNPRDGITEEPSPSRRTFTLLMYPSLNVNNRLWEYNRIIVTLTRHTKD